MKFPKFITINNHGRRTSPLIPNLVDHNSNDPKIIPAVAKIRGRALDYKPITGASGNGAYNATTLDGIGRGAIRCKNASCDTRGAQRLASAIRASNDKQLKDYPAWECAEVNAIVEMLKQGAALDYIGFLGPAADDGSCLNPCVTCSD